MKKSASLIFINFARNKSIYLLMVAKNKKTNSKATTLQSSNAFYKPLLAVLIITLLVFANSFAPNFVQLDDPAYITDNPFIKSLSLHSIATIFTSFYNANYHPLTTLSYAIEFKLFGLKATGYHFTNILIHLINTSLVFLLIFKISKRKEIAIICALFFGIHPMHVESVAWISERKDLLYGMFYLAALYYYYEYIQNETRKNFLFVLLFFTLSLLSKSAAITLPLVLCAFDFYFKRGLNKKIILEKIPFFALSLLFSIITIMSQKSAGAINADLMPKYSLIERFFVASYAGSYYLWKLFLPTSLSALHYAPKYIPSYYYAMPLLLGSIALFVWKAKVLQREIIFGILFYFFAICLTIQIIPVGYAIVSERYSYIPYIGLFFILGHFYVAVVEGKIAWAKNLKPYINYVFVAFAIYFFATTFMRNKIWKDSITLFSDITQKYPEVANAHFSVGKNLFDARDINGALTSFNKALELDSTYTDVYFYRGNLYFDQKNYEAAANDYKTAIALKPKYPEAIYNLGVAYMSLGNNQESVNTITKCIEMSPNEFMYQSRATANFNLKKYKEAIDDYTFALKLNPKLAESFFNRGVCYFYLTQQSNACNDWKQASILGFAKANELIGAYCK